MERFPPDFMFQLENQDVMELRSQFATLVNKKHFNFMPYAFTENGIAMLSSVLNSPEAIQVNIAIMRIFTSLRKNPSCENEIKNRLTNLENENQRAFEILSNRLDSIEEVVFITTPSKKKRIGLR